MAIITKSTPGGVINDPWRIWNSSGGDVSGNYDVDLPYKLHTVQHETDDFYKLKKSGSLLPHTTFIQSGFTDLTYSFWSTNGTHSPSGDWMRTQNFWAFLDVNPRVYHSPDLSGGGAELQRAASRILTSGFDALTFAAEYRKTARTFDKFANRLRKLLHSKKAVGKNIARLWLEGRYGWRQLAFDLRDLNYAVREFDHKRRIWTERSGYSYSETTTIPGSYVVGSGGATVHGQTTYTTEHSIRGSVSAMVQPAAFRASPINTAWELIPLSFIIDWGLTVGNALNAYALVSAASGITSSVGNHSVTRCKSVVDSITTEPGWNTSLSAGSSTWSAFQTSRDPTPVPSNPQVSHRLLRPDQILDLSSLMLAKIVI